MSIAVPRSLKAAGSPARRVSPERDRLRQESGRRIGRRAGEGPLAERVVVRPSAEADSAEPGRPVLVRAPRPRSAGEA
jgi:hypothetical protein